MSFKNFCLFCLTMYKSYWFCRLSQIFSFAMVNLNVAKTIIVFHKVYCLSFRLVRNLSSISEGFSTSENDNKETLRSSLMVNSSFIMKILSNNTVFNAFPSFKCNFIATNGLRCVNFILMYQKT
jgi:hypothetical protein